jgi:hypothetical protein
MRPSGDQRVANRLEVGDWFDLNSGTGDEPLPVKVLELGPSHRSGSIRIVFSTQGGDTGEAHFPAGVPVDIMAAFDFEEEEW